MVEPTRTCLPRPGPSAFAEVDSGGRSLAILEAGGGVILEPTQIQVGRLAVVSDPFGNALVLLDLSAGRYVTDADGRVLGVQPRVS